LSLFHFSAHINPISPTLIDVPSGFSSAAFLLDFNSLVSRSFLSFSLQETIAKTDNRPITDVFSFFLFNFMNIYVKVLFLSEKKTNPYGWF
jgi:hypothetical protein